MDLMMKGGGAEAMKLYHFTAERFLESIKKQGLTNGSIPLFGENGTLLKLLGPAQWLTSDPSWDRQSWATSQLIRYDRTECRLKIVIPKSHRAELVKAQEYLPHIGSYTANQLLATWEGSENWFIYLGNIPQGWIRSIDFKHGYKGECRG